MFLSYYDYFSIVDIILVLAVIVFVVIGYTKGFLTKFISLANSLCGFVFSLLFCKRLSDGFTYKIWGDTLTEKFKANIMAKNPDVTSTKDLLDKIGLPSFITNNIDINLDVNNAYYSLGKACATFVCVVISFFILFIGVSVLCFLLKLLVAACRQSKIIRFLDGILGVLFYLILTYLGVCLLLFVLTFIMQSSGLNGVQQWIINDFQLQSDKWRLTKFLYQNNLIGNFFRIFF